MVVGCGERNNGVYTNISTKQSPDGIGATCLLSFPDDIGFGFRPPPTYRFLFTTSTESTVPLRK